MNSPSGSRPSGKAGPITATLVFALTTLQLAVAEFVPNIPQFEGKAFGARLIAYPVLMAVVPLVWWLAGRRRAYTGPMPWTAFSLIMLPFFVDVTGNTLNLYDSIIWWDDLNHFVNWLFLLWGSGLLIALGNVTPRWALVTLITGLGAILAIAWELGEWYTFIRHGTELNTAYEDTLGDEALGTLGAFVAALIVSRTFDNRTEVGQTAKVED
ncbi:MAG: hypothetical protein ABIR57_06615 [Aeromicrobium sp.]